VSNKIVSPEQFLTKETAEGLRVTLHSTVDLIEYLHSVGFDYVLTSKANQDKIEVSRIYNIVYYIKFSKLNVHIYLILIIVVII